MYHLAERTAELERVEAKYKDFQDDDAPLEEPIRPNRRPASRKRNARSGAAKEPTPRTSLVYSRATSHLRSIISSEVVHAEKGIRPGRVVRAEHSLDQVLDTLHDLGELAIAVTHDRQR